MEKRHDAIYIRPYSTKFSHSNYTLEQVKDQERQLNKQFKAVKSLVQMSCFGWDEEKKMVSTPSEIWDRLTNDNINLQALIIYIILPTSNAKYFLYLKTNIEVWESSDC